MEWTAEAYSEPSQTSKMNSLRVTVVKYFRKKLHLR